MYVFLSLYYLVLMVELFVGRASCGHVFCMTCLNDLFQSSLQATARKLLANNNPKIVEYLVKSIPFVRRRQAVVFKQLLVRYGHPTVSNYVCPFCRNSIWSTPQNADHLSHAAQFLGDHSIISVDYERLRLFSHYFV